MDYCFPQKFANWMNNISQRTQMEASMLSITFMLIGLIVFSVYLTFSDGSIWLKIGIVLNSIFVFVFLFSWLVTQYQQYRVYKEAMGLYENKMEDEELDKRFPFS